MDNKRFYRYNEYLDADDNIQLHVSEYAVIKETTCGHWIKEIIDPTLAWLHGQPREHWVSKTSKKRRAYPNKLDALDSFIHRKGKQILHLEAQLDTANKAYIAGIKAMDEMKTRENHKEIIEKRRNHPYVKEKLKTL